MLINVIRASCRVGRCRSCGARLTWAEVVATGRTMPFNGILIVRPADSLFNEDGAIVGVDPRLNPSHFATCPNAAKHRKGKAATP